MFYRAGAAFVTLCLFTGCAKREVPQEVVRIALLAPQDFTGAEQEAQRSRWLALAISLPLSGQDDLHLIPVTSRRQAADARPTYWVEPELYSTWVNLQVFDGRSMRHLHEVRCAGEDCGHALAAVLDVESRGVRVSKAAFEAFEQAAAAPSQQAFERLTAAHPDLALAYDVWATWLLNQGRTAEARTMLERASSRPEWQPLERAQLNLRAATLPPSEPDAPGAWKALADAWTANAPLQAQAAEAVSQARDFGTAAMLLDRALRGDPRNTRILSTIAYLEAMGGSADKARAAVDRFAAVAGEAVEVSDLGGDVAFIAGDFVSAERQYLEGAQKNSEYQLGRLYAKAAHAALLLNQIPRADAHMQRFYMLYQKGAPGALAVVEGLWLWRTGARSEALRRAERVESVAPLFRFLANPAAGGPAPFGPAIADLAQGRPEAALTKLDEILSRQSPLQTSQWDQVRAVAHHSLGRKDRACELLKTWGAPPAPEDWASLLVWPRVLEVRAECFEASKPQDASRLRSLAANVLPK